MFENMTFERIMADMMADIPDGINTREGSLLYNACAKQAVRLEEAYMYLSGLEKNMNADTADLEHLIRMGNDRGTYINQATYAEFEAQFNISVELGARFNGSDYNYTVFRPVNEEEHIYIVGCDEPGAEPNNIMVDLEPIEFIEGFEWGKILKCTTEGRDQEGEEDYRIRILNSYDQKGFAGNRAYYTERINEMPGVYGCKLERVKTPADVVRVTIIGEDYRTPSEDVINDVQTAVDPTVNSGEGEGLAPIGHKVTISGVQETTVNIETTITYEDGYTYDDLKSYIEQAIEDYLVNLRKTWEQATSIVVRVLQIEAAIVDIEGILDVAGTKINGVESNLQITDGTVPVKGVVTCL